MKRALSTRQGFFAFAAVVCWALLLVIEPQHRWVPISVGTIYAILSVLFYLEELGRVTAPPRRSEDPAD